MKILLLGTRGVLENNEQYYEDYVAFFRNAADYSGVPTEVAYALLDDLYISIGDDECIIRDLKNNRDLTEYGMIFMRGHVRQHIDVVKVVSVYAHEHNILVVNDYSTFRTSSKLAQALQFYTNGLPVARTVYVTPEVLSHPEGLVPDFPCIMKDTYGSHGNLNFKVNSIDEVRSICRANQKCSFVLQRFVPNDCDYRVLVAGNDLLIIKRSATQDTHLNNTSKGATAELVDAAMLPAEILDQSRHIARALDMSVAGVDVLYDVSTHKHSFLEVNSQPQLMTGAFVAEKAQLIGKFLRDLTETPE